MKSLLAILFAVVLLPAVSARAGGSGLTVTASVRGPDGWWDYASFDPVRRRVYIAHGDAVMMIAADSGRVTPDFAAGDHLHAVVPVPGTDRIVTTNSGDDSAKVVDARTGRLLASIPASRDSDAAVWDPVTRRVAVIGGDSGVITLIDPIALRAGRRIATGGPLEFAAPDGRGGLFVNAPATHEIIHVELRSGRIVARYTMPGCTRPTGLALTAGGKLVSACGNGRAEILRAADGEVLASLSIGAGPDAVIYDARRRLALIPSGRTGTLAVIALNGPAADTVVEAVPTALGARTGALDPRTGRVWLPTASFVLPAPEGQRPKMIPGSFRVIVLDRVRRRG